MTEYRFQICGAGLVLRAPAPIGGGGDLSPFQDPAAQPRLAVELTMGPPALPPEPPLASRGDWRLWRRGSRVVRAAAKGPRALPHAALEYDLAAPGRAALRVGEEDWPWATDHLRLWSTLCLPQLLLPLGGLVFHASYIGWRGRGILFTAPSGTGKSTQAELWRVHRGAEVLNGDKAGVSLGGRATAHSMPFSGTSGICRNQSLPLGAVVVLSQAPVNRVRRLGPSGAAAALCSNLFVDQDVPEEWQRALHLLLDLAAEVPVFTLACTPDVGAVEALERALLNGEEARP